MQDTVHQWLIKFCVVFVVHVCTGWRGEGCRKWPLFSYVLFFDMCSSQAFLSFLFLFFYIWQCLFALQLAEHLLSKEVLTREDVEELIGKRPFKSKTTYEEFIEGTGEDAEKTMSLEEFMSEKDDKTEDKKDGSQESADAKASTEDSEGADKSAEAGGSDSGPVAKEAPTDGGEKKA